MTRRIRVVGAVITEKGMVLCAQRGSSGTLPGLWEFPGGKVEDGESPTDALAREIAEELGCTIEVGDTIVTTNHTYDFGVVCLTTFYCRLLTGTPTPSEHSELRWIAPQDLTTVEWAPADVPAVLAVQADLG